MKKYLCEFLGTCILVLFGCGVAVVSNANLVATALAFGLSIVAIGYVIGNVSGAHVNPAVSFAKWIDKDLSTKDFIFYVIAQVLGALAGSGLLILILNSTSLGDWKFIGLGANTYGDLASSGITMLGALVTEVILTFVFVFCVMGVTKDKKKDSVAPIVIGLALTLVHLLGIKLTGTSVNPARSLAPAIFLGGEELEQVWVFIVGPLIGGALASLIYFFINIEEELKAEVTPAIKPVEVVEIKEEAVKPVKNTTSKTKKTTTKKNTTSKPKTTKKTETTKSSTTKKKNS